MKKIILVLGLVVILVGCNAPKQNPDVTLKAQLAETEKAGDLSDEEFEQLLLQAFEKEGLITQINSNFVSGEDTLNGENYANASKITEFTIQPEINFENSPDNPPNSMRTGKLLTFGNSQEMNKFVAYYSEHQLFDYLGVDTNEINPVLIVNKHRPIVLQLNKFIPEVTLTSFQTIYTDCSDKYK